MGSLDTYAKASDDKVGGAVGMTFDMRHDKVSV
jgi:hypothetical protein